MTASPIPVSFLSSLGFRFVSVGVVAPLILPTRCLNLAMAGPRPSRLPFRLMLLYGFYVCSSFVPHVVGLAAPCCRLLGFSFWGLTPHVVRLLVLLLACALSHCASSRVWSPLLSTSWLSLPVCCLLGFFWLVLLFVSVDHKQI